MENKELKWQRTGRTEDMHGSRSQFEKRDYNPVTALHIADVEVIYDDDGNIIDKRYVNIRSAWEK